MKSLSELTHIHGLQLLILSPLKDLTRRRRFSSPHASSIQAFLAGTDFVGNRLFSVITSHGPPSNSTHLISKTEALFNYNEVNKDHTWFSTTIISLQGYHWFIICLLRYCSVLCFDFLFLCFLRHYWPTYTISSMFPLLHYLFVTSLYSLYYLFKVSIVSLSVCYV